MIYPPYKHPAAETILEDVKRIICASETGKSYWDNHKSAITVIKGPMPQALAVSADQIILRVPALQQKGRVEQALDLAGAFVEIKMNAMKIIAKPAAEMNGNYLLTQHLRNVEIMLKVFEVAEELEDAGYDAVKELRLMGLGKVWQAWKTGAEFEKCANIYWEMFSAEEIE